jgi:hypothetical protein
MSGICKGGICERDLRVLAIIGLGHHLTHDLDKSMSSDWIRGGKRVSNRISRLRRSEIPRWAFRVLFLRQKSETTRLGNDPKAFEIRPEITA